MLISDKELIDFVILELIQKRCKSSIRESTTGMVYHRYTGHQCITSISTKKGQWEFPDGEGRTLEWGQQNCSLPFFFSFMLLYFFVPCFFCPCKPKIFMGLCPSSSPLCKRRM